MFVLRCLLFGTRVKTRTKGKNTERNKTSNLDVMLCDSTLPDLTLQCMTSLACPTLHVVETIYSFPIYAFPIYSNLHACIQVFALQGPQLWGSRVRLPHLRDVFAP